MEKHTNILSLIDAYDLYHTFSFDDLIESVLRYSDNDYNPVKTNNNLDLQEIKDLVSLFNNLSGDLEISQYAGYFLNSTVSQGMREQFDVLRFSKESIMNIELKSSMPNDGLEGINNQLVRHKHILSLLGDYKIHLFVYITNDNLLYKLDDSDDIIKSQFDDLIRVIPSDFSEKNLLVNIDTTEMIISPYTDPERFLNHVYFLNDEQKKIKNLIVNSPENLIILKGGPGSGKSLVLFDLANQYTQEGLKVAVIFCAKLNNHIELNDLYEFDIIATNDWRFKQPISNFETYDVLLIDESQRMYSNHLLPKLNGYTEGQLEMFIRLSKEKKVIFSIDHSQSNHKEEIKRNNEEFLCEQPNAKIFELKYKVRSDKQMNNFIRKFLNIKQRGIEVTDFPNVDLIYFSTKQKAVEYTDYLMQQKNYKVIELNEYVTKTTRSLKRRKINSYSTDVYEVHGQEFDNVALLIDSHYEYNSNGLLTGTYPEYYPYNQERSIMLALTRVRRKLEIIVVDNIEIYQIVLRLLTWKEDKVQQPNYHHFNVGLHSTKGSLKKLIEYYGFQSEEELRDYIENNQDSKIELSTLDLYNHLKNNRS